MTDFTHLLRVRYSDCDAQKIVFNGKYAEFIDVAATEFTRHTWGPYNEVLAMGIDSQVVNLNISWKASSSFDDVLAIRVKAGHIGNTSYRLDFAITQFSTQELVATADIVYVMVSAAEFTKTPIPENLKQKLERGAPGVVVDHAGAT